MRIELPPKLESFVRDKVASGLYGDESEVVRDALRLLRDRDFDLAQAAAELRSAIEEGKASGIADRHDLKSLIAELDAEAAPYRR